MATNAPYQVREGDTEGAINAVNQWMRAQPWFTEALHRIGATPGQDIHLNNSQRQQLMQAAQANGMQIDMGDVEVDPAGNFNPKGHKLRNTLIVAGIAAGAIAAPYLAPYIASMGGGGAGSGLAAAQGLEAGATMGITPALGGSLGVGAVAGGGLTGGSTLGTVSSMSRWANGARTAGNAISSMTNAAANNRGIADQTNQQAGRDYENQYADRAQLEAQQRKQAEKDLYRAGWYQNRQASPNNVAGLPPMDPDYMAGLSEMEKAALKRLQTPSQYDTTNMNPLTRFQPTPASRGERVGGYVAPALSTLASLYGGR